MLRLICMLTESDLHFFVKINEPSRNFFWSLNIANKCYIYCAYPEGQQRFETMNLFYLRVGSQFVFFLYFGFSPSPDHHSQRFVGRRFRNLIYKIILVSHIIVETCFLCRAVWDRWVKVYCSWCSSVEQRRCVPWWHFRFCQDDW